MAELGILSPVFELSTNSTFVKRSLMYLINEFLRFSFKKYSLSFFKISNDTVVTKSSSQKRIFMTDFSFSVLAISSDTLIKIFQFSLVTSLYTGSS